MVQRAGRTIERTFMHAQATSIYVRTRLRGRRWLEDQPLDDLLRSLTSTRRSGARISVTTQRILAVVEGAIRRVPSVPSTCLYRSLARYAMCSSLGADVRFVMALRPVDARDTPTPDDEIVTGHAWVEVDGAPFGESIDARLTETYAFPPRDR